MKKERLEYIRTLAERSTAAVKSDIGIYEDYDGDNDLCFARGFLHKRNGEPYHEPSAWRDKAKADAAFFSQAREAVLELVAYFEDQNRKWSPERMQDMIEVVNRINAAHAAGDVSVFNDIPWLIDKLFEAWRLK